MSDAHHDPVEEISRNTVLEGSSLLTPPFRARKMGRKQFSSHNCGELLESGNGVEISLKFEENPTVLTHSKRIPVCNAQDSSVPLPQSYRLAHFSLLKTFDSTMNKAAHMPLAISCRGGTNKARHVPTDTDSQTNSTNHFLNGRKAMSHFQGEKCMANFVKTTNKDSLHIGKGMTSFRQFYFKMLKPRHKTYEYCRTLSDYTDATFLREARYLEKMVQKCDLGLNDFSSLHEDVECITSESDGFPKKKTNSEWSIFRGSNSHADLCASRICMSRRSSSTAQRSAENNETPMVEGLSKLNSSNRFKNMISVLNSRTERVSPNTLRRAVEIARTQLNSFMRQISRRKTLGAGHSSIAAHLRQNEKSTNCNIGPERVAFSAKSTIHRDPRIVASHPGRQLNYYHNANYYHDLQRSIVPERHIADNNRNHSALFRFNINANIDDHPNPRHSDTNKNGLEHDTTSDRKNSPANEGLEDSSSHMETQVSKDWK